MKVISHHLVLVLKHWEKSSGPGSAADIHPCVERRIKG